MLNKLNVMQTDINSVVCKLNELFKNSSTNFFGITCTKFRKSDSKPWFNMKCKSKRRILHKAKRIYDQIKNPTNRAAMKMASKEYEKELNKSFQDYQHKCF